ncbi:MAG: serine hydrolase [Oscillatoriaceae cyanobacterium Prado104]|jgi:CubicO group peptidase (beta-lactamase class C family)|nr:serine hydrolase [Oscillatoriaceae cyanobacterium Prado104]
MFDINNTRNPSFLPQDAPATNFWKPDRQQELTDLTRSNSAIASPTIQGTSGDDALLGTSEADWIAGNKGNDYLNGYAGDDRLWGGNGDNRLFGGAGDDWLLGKNGKDQLYGGSGNDRLLGNSNSDRLDGGTGSDVLNGGKQEDIAIDRDGGDTLTGGSGSDQFWIGNGSLGATAIADFETGRDLVKMLEIGLSYEQLQIRDSQAGAVISHQGKDLVLLNGVAASALNSSQFDFGNANLAFDLQAGIDRVVQNTGTPGVTASVTMSDGTTWIGSSGVSDLLTETALKSGDRFNIGSVTKPMVATIVLQLSQERTLNLNDTLDKWLPDLAQSIPNGQQITVRQLLNHTSGIKDYFLAGLGQDLEADPTLRFKSLTTEEIVLRYVSGKAADFAPGESFNYSNTNYRLLGEIVEAATGTSIAQQLQARIFEPLDMKDSFYAERNQIPGGFTSGYIDLDRNGTLDIDTSNVSLQGLAGTAGAVVSTAADLARFTRAMFEGELLAPATLEQMQTDSFPNSGYGLGIYSLTFPNGAQVIEHTGGGLGWQSRIAYLPQADFTLTTLTNSDDLPAAVNIQLVKEVLSAIDRNLISESDKQVVEEILSAIEQNFSFPSNNGNY